MGLFLAFAAGVAGSTPCNIEVSGIMWGGTYYLQANVSSDNAPVYKQFSTEPWYLYRTVVADQTSWVIGYGIGSGAAGRTVDFSASPDQITPTAVWKYADWNRTSDSWFTAETTNIQISCSSIAETPPPTPKPTLTKLLGIFTETYDTNIIQLKSAINAGSYDAPSKCKIHDGGFSYTWFCQLADDGKHVQSGCGCTPGNFDNGNVFRQRRQLSTTSKTCAKGLVEGGDGFDNAKDIKNFGPMGDGNNAPYNWNYTCPDGESPYHNKTITGDYEKVEDQWQVECTEHQIAFQCCTDSCECHDPVTTHDADNGVDIISQSITVEGESSTGSVALAAVASIAGFALVGGVAVAARARGGSEHQCDALQVSLSDDGEYVKL